MTVASGTRLGHYTILAPLGAGGMGEVWLAEDRTLKRKVALKVLPAAMAADPDRLARFQREAEAVAALTHPNIVTLHSVEQDGDVRFLTMELVEGQSLDKLIPRGGLPLAQVLDIGAALADALVASHEKGIIHRDLKPANVMLTRDRRVKVLDFGLAKLRDEAAPNAETATAHRTGEGRVLGTVAYMSPEQAEGRPVDARSDLFALGIVLFEMATGERPFKGDTSLSVLSAILRDTPKSVTALRQDLPREFARIVKRCLHKDPDERYQTAKDVRSDLRGLKADLASGEIASAAESPLMTRMSWRRWLAIGAGARVGTPPLQGDSSDSQMIAGLVKRHKRTITGFTIAATVILAALLYFAYRVVSRAPGPSAALEISRVTVSGDLTQADVSPDGKYVAYVRSTAGKQSLWMKQLATDSDVQIATLGEDHCYGVTFSRDGSYVYFVRRDPLKPNGDLYQLPSLGGTAKKMLTGISGVAAFSPDGHRVAFVRSTIGEDTLLTASLDGSGERALASYKFPESIYRRQVGWSPDGRSVAFIHRTPQARTVLTTVAAEGGVAKAVGSESWRIDGLVWLPGSRDLVMVANGQLYKVQMGRGETRQITHDLATYDQVRASADGKTLMALQHERISAVQVTTPGKESETKTLGAGNQTRDGQWGLAWTPGGKIVYYSLRDGNDLWETGTDGSIPERLTNGIGTAHPAVSPRGGFVAFTNFRNGEWNIWRIEMDGTNLKQLTRGKKEEGPAISPDGRWVVFTSLGGKDVLMKVSSEGGPASQLTDYDSARPAISPDGKWIACRRGPNQHLSLSDPRRPEDLMSVAMVPFAGGQPAKVFPLPATAGDQFAWSPDGRAIAFINTVNGVGNIWDQPVAGGPPQPATHFKSDQIFWFDWSRDGRLALSRGADRTDAVLIRNFQ